jgi:trans-aconitate methyltransferase
MPNERMYYEFADWFHLITAPDEYAEEAAFYISLAVAALDRRPETVLELGSGGGNNASHYRLPLKATLTDLFPHMLALSRTVNPNLEHIQGDMCSLRVGRQFDIVFAHERSPIWSRRPN